MRYSFSGHESFQCKTLWLKKGFDFISQGKNFNDNNAVIDLAVGKNMVSAIRFWLKAFGLSENDTTTHIAQFIFSDLNGKDRFSEDILTLWILHYHLVNSEIASIYNLIFCEYQREKQEFDQSLLLAFIKRKCSTPEQKNVFNENTVKKDIKVFTHNYTSPKDNKSIEDFCNIFIDLNLIRNTESGYYTFNKTSLNSIPSAVILYALIDIKGNDKTISFDLIQKLALIFCLNISDLITIIKQLEAENPTTIVYSDNSGIKNIQFLNEIDKYEVLNRYYTNQ